MTSTARTVSGYRKRHNRAATKVDITFRDERGNPHAVLMIARNTKPKSHWRERP